MRGLAFNFLTTNFVTKITVKDGEEKTYLLFLPVCLRHPPFSKVLWIYLAQ